MHIAELRMRGWHVLGTDERWVDESRIPWAASPHRRRPVMNHYTAAIFYTLSMFRRYVLDPYRAVRVLDIGSSLEQNLAVNAADSVTLTMLDVRLLPQMAMAMLPFTFVQGSAMALPFSDASFDAVTSTCVLCHVGDGRYDDTLDASGDIQMLREIARVLIPGGHLIAMVGPILPDTDPPTVIYNIHRMYTFGWLREQCAAVGLEIIDTVTYGVREEAMAEVGASAEARYYGCITARRVVPN